MFCPCCQLPRRSLHDISSFGFRSLRFLGLLGLLGYWDSDVIPVLRGILIIRTRVENGENRGADKGYGELFTSMRTHIYTWILSKLVFGLLRFLPFTVLMVIAVITNIGVVRLIRISRVTRIIMATSVIIVSGY